MYELIKPCDLIVSIIPDKNKGSWSFRTPVGISIYHKPSDISVNVDKHRSQHKNKHEALIILKDLLTEFSKGDIIVTECGIGEVRSVFKCDDRVAVSYLNEEGYLDYDFTDNVAHSEEGYEYKHRKNGELNAS